MDIATSRETLSEMTVRKILQLVLARSKPDIAGQYSTVERFISGSNVKLAQPYDIRPLMKGLGQSLTNAKTTPREAFDMHYRLVTIHPFDDGNGRTARLLMNLMLIRGGYRPIAIRTEDRFEYTGTLESAQLGESQKPFQALMHRRLQQTMVDYVGIVREAVRSTAEIEGRDEQDDEPQPAPQTSAQKSNAARLLAAKKDVGQ